MATKNRRGLHFNRTSFVALLTILLSLFIAGDLSAQTAQSDSALLILQNFLSSVQELDWESCVSMLHPSILGQLSQVGKFSFYRYGGYEFRREDDSLMYVEYFDGSHSIAEVQALDSVRFVIGFAALACDFIEHLPMYFTNLSYQVLGVVEESPQLRHYVLRFRTFSESITKEEVSVVSMEMHENRWLVSSADEGTWNLEIELYKFEFLDW